MLTSKWGKARVFFGLNGTADGSAFSKPESISTQKEKEN
jgi:hypothetical protein